MSLAQAMKAHEETLRCQVTALDVPVTEVVVFELLNDATENSLDSIRKDFILNSTTATGLLRLSWGQSLDDPKTILAQDPGPLGILATARVRDSLRVHCRVVCAGPAACASLRLRQSWHDRYRLCQSIDMGQRCCKSSSRCDRASV
jgi:hypothetical protein